MPEVDYFLKLDGVEGESQDTGHKGELEVLSFKLGAESKEVSRAESAEKGKVKISRMTVVVHLDKSAPLLFQKAALFTKIPTAILTGRKAGGEQFEFFKITLSDVLIMGVDMGHESVEITLDFGSIDMGVKEQTSTGVMSGVVKFMHNLMTNQ